MFWENFYGLCHSKQMSPNGVAKEIGISSGAITAWKQGKVPHHDTLIKIANYFGVSVDYLLGNEKQPEAPDLADTEMQDVIIYNRNGKTVRKRLPKAEYEAAIKMLDALGSDFPDI